MSMLTSPNELVNDFNFKGLIYGQPGICKTTLALSSSNPVLLDFDKGLYRVEKIYQVPSLQPKSYNEVITLLKGNELNSFDTIVIDTIGKLIDLLITSDIIPKKKDGCTPSIQGYGVLKSQFKSFFELVKSKNKNIIFVAHEKEEKDDDKTVKRIDAVGSSGKDLLKELDFVGYIQAKGRERTISFAPEESFYAKNAMKLNDVIKIPNLASGNTFFVDKIETAIKERMLDDNKAIEKYNDLIDVLQKTIEGAETPEKLSDLKTEIYDNADYPHVLSSKMKSRNMIADFAKTKGWVFNKEAGVFKEAVNDETIQDNA